LPEESRRGFAIVYALLLSFIAWQWLGLRKHDTAEMAALTLRYVIGMSVPIGLVAISAIIDNPDTRLILWTAAIAVTIAGLVAQIFRSDEALEDAFRVTESMAERFGLFTIIVLGEVVVGVVDGLSESSRSGRTIATGIVALVIGFGFWWNYFDFVGRRAPRRGALTRGLWNLEHLPMWLSDAAAGAGMVSLVEHANDNRTPAATAWLVASSPRRPQRSHCHLHSSHGRCPHSRAVAWCPTRSPQQPPSRSCSEHCAPARSSSQRHSPPRCHWSGSKPSPDTYEQDPQSAPTDHQSGSTVALRRHDEAAQNAPVPEHFNPVEIGTFDRSNPIRSR